MELIGIGVMLIVAIETLYAIFGIWEIQYGLAIGMVVILVGMIKIGKDMEIFVKR